MPPAIQTPITPEGINEPQSGLSDYYGTPIPVPQVEQPQKAFRGFTNEPGYAFKGEGVSTEYVPEDYWKTGTTVKNADEFAKVAASKPKPPAVSVKTLARMSPADSSEAMLEVTGPRPIKADVRLGLKNKAMVAFGDQYASIGREPTAEAWGIFDENFAKDQNVAKAVQGTLDEWDTKYEQLLTQIKDTRKANSIRDARIKTANNEANEKIKLLPKEQQQAEHMKHRKALNAAMTGNPDEIEQNIDAALDAIPGTSNEGKLSAQEKSDIIKKRQLEVAEEKPVPDKQLMTAEGMILNPDFVRNPAVESRINFFNKNAKTPYIYVYDKAGNRKVPLPLKDGQQITAQEVTSAYSKGKIRKRFPTIDDFILYLNAVARISQ